jgi:hypothetical protein
MGNVALIYLPQDRGQWLALVDEVKSILVP